jgi:hypothetical protein
MVRRVPSKQRNANVIREPDSRALARLALLLLCGLVLAGAFLYACGQHFAALSFGYQTEALRRQREHLLEDRRRFLLAREEAASPGRLERAARQLGMQPLQPEQLDPLKTERTRVSDKRSELTDRSTVSPAIKKTKSSVAKTHVKRRPVTPH